MSNKGFNHLTVVSVTGHDDYTLGSMYAIERSCLALPGAKGVLVSPSKPDNLPAHITHVPVAPFGYLEYNIFVLYMLDQLVETDYCLLVQNDGWVLNSDNWQDEFWQYDYIGAPIPDFFEPLPSGAIKAHSFFQKKPETTCFVPQNGGFSLRSKRLLGLPRQLGLPLQIAAPDRITQLPIKIDWEVLQHHEDVFLTVTHRERLEKADVRFAPTELAARFSMETPSINEYYDIPLTDILGIHFFLDIKLVDTNKVFLKYSQDYWTNPALVNTYHHKVIKLLLHYNYDVQLLSQSL